jgi:hypothetical protein
LSSRQHDRSTINVESSSKPEEMKYLPSSPSFLTFSYKENLSADLDRLVQAGKSFNGLIIDLMQTGFSLPLENLVKFSLYAKRLLKPQGVFLFVKADGAITLTKDDPGGGLTLNVYDSPFGIFARHPMLVDYVCATVPGIDRRRLKGSGSTLANHILYTSTPVLTENGSRMKNEFNMPAPQSWVIQAIDDYATIDAIARTLDSHNHLMPDETMRILQELELQALIYPIFSRIQFLANCHRNHKPFRLGHYMVASGIITESQLEQLLEQQEDEGWGKSQKTYLGVLAVRSGYINSRELEVLLADQCLYGGYNKKSNETDRGPATGVSAEAMRDSMIGSLGAIDTYSLLQSLSTAAKTGLLTVENRDKVFILSFTNGQPTHARISRLKGYDALTEFLVSWTEGIFVFKDKAISEDLDEECVLNHTLERIILDSALLNDYVTKIVKELPGGRNAILERVWNFEGQWQTLSSSELKYIDDSPVTDRDRHSILDLSQFIDGLSTLDEIMRAYDVWPGHMIIKAVSLLIEHDLLNIEQSSLFQPLSTFQRISKELEQIISKETNRVILNESLHYVHGNSESATRFSIDSEGRVSLNLSEIKSSATAVSALKVELRRWMEAYLAHCRKQVDSQLVDSIVARIVNSDN